MKSHVTTTGTDIRTIVVGIDFSEFAQTALIYAMTIARHRGAKIVLLHVIDPITYAVAMEASRLMEGDLLRSAESKLKELAKVLDENGIEYQIVVREGRARETIAHVAREYGADLLAIGCHGHRRIDRLVLGSNAEQILRVSPCPVMVAGPEAERPQKQFFLCEHILFPIDMEQRSDVALEQIAHFAMTHDADLTLLHVMPRYSSRKDKTSVLKKLDTLAKDLQRPGLVVHSKIRTGVISEAILAQAHEGHSSAIVLGVTESKDFHKGTPAGLICTLISEATCPIFTFRGNHLLNRHIDLSRHADLNHRKMIPVPALRAS